MKPEEALSLDVDSPDKVPAALRAAAQAYYESAGELESAWQDKAAGRPWDQIAGLLEAMAEQIEREVL